MAQRIKFTKRALERWQARHVGQRADVYDSNSAGLVACLRAGGNLSFYLYKRVQGRPQRIHIGRFPEVTVEQARTLADKYRGAIAEGRDPQAMKRTARSEITLGDLWEYYLERHAKPYKRTWKGDEWQFNKYLAHWKNRQLSGIRRADVQAWHAKVGKDHGTYAANRALALLRSLFNKAGDELGWTKPNPAAGVKKFAEQSRERFLGADEMPKFFQALNDEPNETLRDFFAVSLLTGARRGNVLAMLWAEVNLERGTWLIPRIKNEDRMTVVLPPQAVEILRRRHDERNGSPYVFPSHGATKHLASPKTAWARLLKRAGIADLRMHDLRRSLGSWQAIHGASLPIIGKSLGHRNQATTAVYARMDLDPVRVSVNRAVDAMYAVVEASQKKESHDDDK
jgi:integrase